MFKTAVLLSPKNLYSSKTKGFNLIAQLAMPMPSALTMHQGYVAPHYMFLSGCCTFQNNEQKVLFRTMPESGSRMLRW